MKVRRGNAGDHGLLLVIWEQSVRATHGFLTEDDIQSFLPLVRNHALPALELWVLEADDGDVMGFMGLSENKLEALFLEPKHFRRGGGATLGRRAQDLKGPLTVDVNEQNPSATRFYEALGFVVEGRSELDDSGRPFPLLHMRQSAETS